jgi:succinate dehydrogenase/fumarate reductase cytochrome b subunit
VEEFHLFLRLIAVAVCVYLLNGVGLFMEDKEYDRHYIKMCCALIAIIIILGVMDYNGVGSS